LSNDLKDKVKRIKDNKRAKGGRIKDPEKDKG
jgi:hypothetical protein